MLHRGRLHRLWLSGRARRNLWKVYRFPPILLITWVSTSTSWTRSALVVFKWRYWWPSSSKWLRWWHRGFRLLQTSGSLCSSSTWGFRRPTLIAEHFWDILVCRIGGYSQYQLSRSCHHRESDTECSFHRCFRIVRSHYCRSSWWYLLFLGPESDQVNHAKQWFWEHLFLGSLSRVQSELRKFRHQLSRCNLGAFQSRAFTRLYSYRLNCSIFCSGWQGTRTFGTWSSEDLHCEQKYFSPSWAHTPFTAKSI